MHTHVTASIHTENYKTIIRSEHNELISDEAVSVGGGGTGFNPHELLAASLASCTCITLRMYAERKQWPIEKIDVQVSISKDKVLASTHFERSITVHGHLSDEQRDRLLEIANVCPIHKTLSNGIYINTSIS